MPVRWPTYRTFLKVICPYSSFVIEIRCNDLMYLGIEIARNGIYITRDMADKALGDGFVAFISMDNAYKALDLYHEKYLEDRFALEKRKITGGVRV